MSKLWLITDKGDQDVRRIIDGEIEGCGGVPHYSRRTPGDRQYTRNGQNLVFVTADCRAAWVTFRPTPGKAERQDGLDAWECALFRNEGPHTSSDLIREAVALTCALWGEPPRDGIITYVKPECVVKGTNGIAGYCYRRAGWRHRGEARDGKPLLRAPRSRVIESWREWSWRGDRGGALRRRLSPTTHEEALAVMVQIGVDRVGVHAVPEAVERKSRKPRAKKAAEAEVERVPNRSRQEIVHGDIVSVLEPVPADTFDASVGDPPGGLDFMGKAWDSDHGGRDGWVAVHAPIFREIWRTLKPGAYALMWAHPRTSHWTALALEDAGFFIDNLVMHVFGSGVPMSKNIGRAIDMHFCTLPGRHYEKSLPEEVDRIEGDHLCPQHPAGDPYRGFGTALKSAFECWVLAQKPFRTTYAENVLRYGTGGLNIDACCVPRGEGDETSNHARSAASAVSKGVYGDSRAQETYQTDRQRLGGFPAHLILSHADDCQIVGTKRVRANGSIGEGTAAARGRRSDSTVVTGGDARERGEWRPYGNGDGTETVDEYECVEGCPYLEMNRQAGRDVARYFYVPKPKRAEKDAGCEALPGRVGAEVVGRKEGSAGVRNARAGAGRSAVHVKNTHITVKSIALMRYLLRLVAGPGKLVLSPFDGSGTTMCAAALEGVDCIGIEREEEYVAIGRARLAHWRRVAGCEEATAAAADGTNMLDGRAAEGVTVSPRAGAEAGERSNESESAHENEHENAREQGEREMAKIPDHLIDQVGDADPTIGRNRFRDGEYLLLVKKASYDTVNIKGGGKGDAFIIEHRVIEAKPVAEQPADVVPNEVGSDVGHFIANYGNSAVMFHGKTKAYVLGLLGLEHKKKDPLQKQQVVEMLAAMSGDAQLARGMLIRAVTYHTQKRSDGEDFLGINFYPVPGENHPQSPGVVKRRAELDKEDAAAQAGGSPAGQQQYAQGQTTLPPQGQVTQQQVPVGVPPVILPAGPPVIPQVPAKPWYELEGWIRHPQNPLFFYKGTEYKLETELQAMRR